MASRITIAVVALLAVGAGMSIFRGNPIGNAQAAPAKVYPRTEISPSARAHVRAKSKDPGSLKFRNEFTTKPGMYCGEVNGKNSFGAYTGFKRFITNEKTLLLDDGSTNNFTKAWREFCMPGTIKVDKS